MEGTSVLSSSYSASSLHHQYSATTHLKVTSRHSCTSPSSLGKWQLFSITFLPRKRKNQAAVLSVSCPRATLRTSTFVLHKSSLNPTKDKDVMPKIDKSGRFCSPRAARELALMIIYAACLEGSDPVRLFEKRMNARREPGYEFRKELLLEYNHMNFGGSPVTTETLEEADNLIRIDEQESAIDAEVLSAPPKLVYSKLLLRFTRKLLVAVVDKWDSHVLVIDKIAPPVWKDDPAGRILEFCLLHLAMSEITVIETPRQIVINEAVDLAKRFCDGSAPRTINGCLRTFVNMKDESGHSGGTVAEPSGANQEVEV